MEPISYERAVEILDTYMQKKTVHATKDILEAMRSVCQDAKFTTVEDQQEFAQKCRNFEIYVQETGKTAMGRKQFEEWWDIQDSDDEPGDYSTEAMEELQEDPLTGFNLDEVIPKSVMPCDITHVWDNRECPHCKIQELEDENRELKARLQQIQELIERGW